jgi:hypothetical protein
MHFGASMFFTDYSMTSVELAQALEARGFESVWAPEHSHIPTSRRTPFPGGGDLPKQYYDAMDPFVTLTAAAMATKQLKVGTGVCLVNQRDPIQTAKLVASIDQVSGGRFLFGIGVGWNAEEMEDHGTVFASRAKLVRARRGDEGDLDQVEGRIPRRVRQLPRNDGLAEVRAEAACTGDRRWRLPAGGAARGALWRRLDSAGRPRRHLRRDGEIPRDAKGGGP